MMITRTKLKTLMHHQILIHEATRWLGVQEHGGNNRGQIVEMFQRTIGRAVREPWCMSFVQYCLEKADELYSLVQNDDDEHWIHGSEHCMSVWRTTDLECRIKEPRPGLIAIWRHKGTDNGHTGIVVDVDGSIITTIEGNTGTDDKTVVREGDGVRRKRRPLRSIGSMYLVGFLDPWPEI